MPRHKSKSPPKYRHHKARNLAVVTVNGRDHYLGAYGSLESYENYAQVIAEMRQGLYAAPLPSAEYKNPISSLTVGELTLAYFQHWPATHAPAPA